MEEKNSWRQINKKILFVLANSKHIDVTKLSYNEMLYYMRTNRYMLEKQKQALINIKSKCSQ